MWVCYPHQHTSHVPAPLIREGGGADAGMWVCYPHQHTSHVPAPLTGGGGGQTQGSGSATLTSTPAMCLPP